MKLEIKNIDFPAKVELSFDGLLKTLRSQLDQLTGTEREYLEDLLKRCSVLNSSKGISKAVLKKHRSLVDELMRVICPLGLTHNEIKAIAPPWGTDFIYKSARFEKILSRAGDKVDLGFGNYTEDEYFRMSCTYILAGHFGYSIGASAPFFFDIPDLETGITRSYRLATNVDFLEVKPTSKAKDISIDDYHQLMDNYQNIELWKEKFPNDSWVFSGFSILNLMDLSKDRLISDMTNHLLRGRENHNSMMLQNDISKLMGTPIIMSFVNLEGGNLIQGLGKEISTLMMGQADAYDARTALSPESHRILIEEKEHLAIPDVKAFATTDGSLMAKNIKKSKALSYYAAPVIYNGNFLGLLELGSTTKGALNSSSMLQVNEILPLLAIAGNRIIQEFKNKVEAVIQAECTTIHPAVKWRFEEEATKHIFAEEQGEDHQFENLVFSNVFPLFGQLDIRSSSVIRNEGIKRDLQTQLKGAIKIFKLAYRLNPMPLYEELTYVLEQHHQQLEEDMVSASEQDILLFISTEVHPILDHLATTHAELGKAIGRYKSKLHSEHGFVYKERASFDFAVNTLNKVLANHMDLKQEEAQAMFPHHFERYSTDGLEFNMYIGESISPGKGFHPMLVKNLRLWQLIVMVEMEREYNEVKKTLDKPLSVAALVLAHSSPLSIQYRMDEKQFDVEGAYNARYEIIKKRIDKAHIKGTNERITEPGQMVVVYATDEDEREYLRYFAYLQSKGYLSKNKPELLTLEDLQGVSGLKALRLGIDYQDNDGSSDLSMEEIMLEIEGKGKKVKA